MSKIYFDKKKIDITPKYPVSMIGYFNDRISEGILDPLYSRILALSDGENSLLFIQIDTCLFSYEFAKIIKDEISNSSPFNPDKIMIIASHTHTGPALESFFESKEEKEYKKWLRNQIINSVKLLDINNECIIKTSKQNYEDLNSNRRWFMKDGKLLTNPPKGSPEILKPEGPVDRELLSFVIKDINGNPQSIITNISNHTDTIGGNLISADWPGFMEKRIQLALSKDVMVIPTISPAGNINHFDFSDTRNQTSYLEAERIGNAYGDIALASLEKVELLNIDKLSSFYKEIQIPSREIDKHKIVEAKENIEKLSGEKIQVRDLNAEDLAKENVYVKIMFQRELLKYFENRKESYPVPFQAFFFEDTKASSEIIAIVSIPGEPFVEIGLSLKKIESYKLIIPISLANGYYGYIPLEEHFKHGGYEVLTTPSNCLSTKAGSIIINEYERILEDFKNK